MAVTVGNLLKPISFIFPTKQPSQSVGGGVIKLYPKRISGEPHLETRNRKSKARKSKAKKEGRKQRKKEVY